MHYVRVSFVSAVCAVSAFIVAPLFIASADSATGGPIAAGVLKSQPTYQVTAKSGLNCRDKASKSGAVVFLLATKTIVDVVDFKTVKADGLVWIKVNPRGDSDGNDCYAAAETFLLKPVDPILGKWTKEEPEGEVAKLEIDEKLEGLGVITKDGIMVTAHPTKLKFKKTSADTYNIFGVRFVDNKADAKPCGKAVFKDFHIAITGDCFATAGDFSMEQPGGN